LTLSYAGLLALAAAVLGTGHRLRSGQWQADPERRGFLPRLGLFFLRLVALIPVIGQRKEVVPALKPSSTCRGSSSSMSRRQDSTPRSGRLFHYFAEPGEEFRGEHILNTFLSPPGLFLGILLGMQLVLQERDSRTIEVMFAISRSRFRVWVVKALTVYLAIFILLLFLAVLSHIFIAAFPFASVVLNAMVPAILFGNLAVFFSSSGWGGGRGCCERGAAGR
jgi:hypothetical protein